MTDAAFSKFIGYQIWLHYIETKLAHVIIYININHKGTYFSEPFQALLFYFFGN